MPERSNGTVSKTVVPPRGTEGSNPSLSAGFVKIAKKSYKFSILVFLEVGF